MDTNRVLKQTLQYKPKGRRNIGRPRKRWRDQFHFEQEDETHLILHEHDDDGDYELFKVRSLAAYFQMKVPSCR